jgi:hypothetical protein
MTDSLSITLACCGLLGTLVTDGGCIERAFSDGFRGHITRIG